MEISYSRAAVKVINALDRPTKQRIKKAVEGLPKGDIVPLSGSTRLYRLRVGDWRVVFSYSYPTLEYLSIAASKASSKES